MPTTWELSATTFARLPTCFDAEADEAAAKYEDLRRALVRFFERRGMVCAEELTDATFNRVARKLDEGIQIVNIYTAFDINADFNGQGDQPAAIGNRGSVRELVPIFERHGFRWGGLFSTPDGMHFEIARLL